MRAAITLLLVPILLAPTTLAAPGDYAGTGTYCFQNGLIVGGIPGLLTNCRVEYAGSVTVLGCGPSSCSYRTTGSATVRSDVAAFLEVSTSVTTDTNGAAWTCRSASATPVMAHSCAGSTVSTATVAPGACVNLWASGTGYVVLASSNQLPPGFLYLQGVGSAVQFGKICRTPSGAGYVA